MCGLASVGVLRRRSGFVGVVGPMDGMKDLHGSFAREGGVGLDELGEG